MRNCPKCTKDVKDDGRCTNTVCVAYSHKVLDEVETDGNLKCIGYGVNCHSMKASRYRQNTKYINEETNWIVLCEDCQKENDEYWADMWSDYYSGCL